jgi:hypothetical protein
VFFFLKGPYFYARPNPLLLIIEPGLFINSNICGRFWGKIGTFGRHRPEKITLAHKGVVYVQWFFLAAQIKKSDDQSTKRTHKMDILLFFGFGADSAHLLN